MIAQTTFLLANSPLGNLPKLISQVKSVPALRLQRLSILMVLASLLILPTSGFSQAVKSAASASTPLASKPYSAASTNKQASSGSSWAELTPMQQQALQPLASSWNGAISAQQKRKWLAISKNYPSLPPEGQATLHSRMNEWVTLSPQQRAQARLNFGKTRELSKQLTPEEKKAKWQTYQALSPEEKQRLASKASPKPAGAATAVKPVSPQKLTAVPPHVARPTAKATPKVLPLLPAPATDSVTPRPGETGTGGTGVAPQR